MTQRISLEDALRLVRSEEAEQVSSDPVEVEGVSTNDIKRLFTPKTEQMQRMRSDLKTGGEWRFGIRALDEATLGGARPGNLVTLIGKTHTGKSLLAMNMVAKNRNRSWMLHTNVSNRCPGKVFSWAPTFPPQ